MEKFIHWLKVKKLPVKEVVGVYRKRKSIVIISSSLPRVHMDQYSVIVGEYRDDDHQATFQVRTDDVETFVETLFPGYYLDEELTEIVEEHVLDRLMRRDVRKVNKSISFYCVC